MPSRNTLQTCAETVQTAKQYEPNSKELCNLKSSGRVIESNVWNLRELYAAKSALSNKEKSSIASEPIKEPSWTTTLTTSAHTNAAVNFISLPNKLQQHWGRTWRRKSNFRTTFKTEKEKNKTQYQCNVSVISTNWISIRGDASYTWTGVTINDTVFLIDTNIPGLPYQTPTAHPTNFHLVQLRQFLSHGQIMEC